MLEQQVESLKGMVSSSESQQQEHAKAQMQKITALQEQVSALQASSRTAESECTSLKSELADATRKEQEVGAGRVCVAPRMGVFHVSCHECVFVIIVLGHFLLCVCWHVRVCGVVIYVVLAMVCRWCNIYCSYACSCVCVFRPEINPPC